MTNKKIKYQPVSPEITELVAEHGNSPEALLEVLVELQSHPAGLSSATVTDAARALKVPPHKAYGMATFYSMLSLEERKNVLRVCDGPVCWLKRATTDDGQQTIEAFQSSIDDGQWSVERTSCLGLCDRAPSVLVNDEQAGPATPADAQKLCEGWRGVQTDYSHLRSGEVRVMMANADKIDPDSIDSALEYAAYDGLKSALQETPTGVLDLVEASGLQGRGGAGFPVGRKWKFVAGAKGSPKYMICNADESEPLIFKDRVLIDTNPHQLLEGITIGGYACGASEAWIYIRGEYEYQARRLERAIEQAEEKGYLGENILGSGFSFKIHVHRGAGAYICGEETALIESLEGKRGEPRLRPPYPPSYGFRGKPTAVNNVESYSAVPSILRNGVDWWKSRSSYTTPGTKMYMVLGHVKNPGLFEAPFGITLRQIINDFGGGMLDGSEFQFALCGGAAGTIVNEGLLDVPLDYSSAQKGISIGAGAFLVCDETVSPVAFLRELLHFFAAESCGKCTPCRVGTWHSHEILSRMTEGRGWKSDTKELRTLAEFMQESSFCGLGQSVGIPMMSALKHFGDEFARAETVEPLHTLR
jgi:NADH:ubiquinone oxidoreductase subunit F (NADH-binding)/NADH:ubiquinone oxidoreductase subunit E